MNLNRRYHYSFIALMKPFQGPSQIEQYRVQLDFNHAGVNRSAKIWYFWRED